MRQASPTAWVPQSKPVRLVELGCPAVDKGANQPNVFIDPKSSESTPPYYSTGGRDDLIQRRYIEALLSYWQGGNNPTSGVYGAPMLALDHCHVWTWDARPFPEFPTRDDVWSDGVNWRLGHWLTGRAGQSLVGEIVKDIAARAGLPELAATAVDGVLAGYVVLGTSRARDEIARLGLVFGFDVVDRAEGPVCVTHTGDETPTWIATENLEQPQRDDSLTLSRAPEGTLPVEVRVQFNADEGDYRPAVVSAAGLDHESAGVLEVRLPALSDRDTAVTWAQDALTRARAEGDSGTLHLPPSFMALEAGDLVRLDTGPEGRVWKLSATDGGAARRGDITGTQRVHPARSGPEPKDNPAPLPSSRPLVTLLDLPVRPGQGLRGGWLAAAWSKVWPGSLTLYAGPDTANASSRGEVTTPAFIGVLTDDLAAGFEGRWDRRAVLRLQLYDGVLSSASALDVLAGTNRVAIESSGRWEVLGYLEARLEPDGSWTLSGLLRGLGGTPVDGAGADARVVVLDEALSPLPVEPHEAGSLLTILAVPPGKALNDISVRQIEGLYGDVEHRPLSPVHLRAAWSGTDLELAWVRRARLDADAWAYGDVPLDEAREAYQLIFLDSGSEVATKEVSAPSYVLREAERISLYPSGLAAASVEVAQISDRYGPGAAARLSLAHLA